MTPYHLHALPNGLQVLLVPRKESVSSTVLVIAKAGSDYETKEINGVSHFLEHLMFKGTTDRPSAELIASELESLGAEYNAFTGEEYTCYWAKAEAKKLPRILDVVADISLNPLFDPAEIEKERGVVIEEIHMYEDNPMRRVPEVFSKLLYGDQPAGWPIAGPESVIRTISRESIMAYRARHYHAKQMLVVVSGSFDRARILKDITLRFKDLPSGTPVKKPKVKEFQKGPQVLLEKKDSAQTHLIMGVRAFPITDKRRHALRVLAGVLGAGMSSRLFRKVREELGAAYYVRASADLYADRGTLAVSVGAEHSKLEAVIVAVCEEFRRITKELVPPAELQKVKDYLTGTFMLGIETSDELANFYAADQVVFGAITSPAQTVREIMAVTPQEVRKVAQAILKNDRLNLALIGPREDGESLRLLLHI